MRGVKALVLLTALSTMGCHRKTSTAERAGAATSVAAVAPPPAPAAPKRARGLDVPEGEPSARPIVEVPGKDVSGHVRSYVDVAQVRSLLAHERYDDLERFFDEAQRRVEEDASYEYWTMDAADAFASSDAALDPLLDAWVAAKTSSFAAPLARAAHWVAIGYNRRGAAYRKDTPEKNFAGMRDAFAKAEKDLTTALTVHPRLVAAHRLRIQMDVSQSGADTSVALVDALRACPACFQPRVTYILSLRPRWGGSLARMHGFATRGVDTDKLPLSLLDGYTATAEAEDLVARDPDRAQALADRAVTRGEHWEFFDARAGIEATRGDLDRALADANRAVELRPSREQPWITRLRVHRLRREWEAAGHDVLRLREMGWHDLRALEVATHVVEGLVYQAWQAGKDGHVADAVRLLDLAGRIAPDNVDVQKRRAALIAGSTPMPNAEDDAEVAPLRAAAEAAPNDFVAQQALDRALSRRREYAKAVALWTSYLERRPEDGRAFLERGGAWILMGNRERALADATRACELGNAEGCTRAKQVSSARR